MTYSKIKTKVYNMHDYNYNDLSERAYVRFCMSMCVFYTLYFIHVSKYLNVSRNH